MIIEYASKTFETQVEIIRLIDKTAEINIKGRQRQQEVRRWVADQLAEFLMLNCPEEWEDPLDQYCQKINVKVSNLDEGSQLWLDVNTQFEQKKPDNGKILSIHIIQNLKLWKDYQAEIRGMTDRDGNVPECLRLWHGTYKTDPEIIYKGAGLNINYANNGYWGRAIYFAVNASYSCPNYSYEVPG